MFAQLWLFADRQVWVLALLAKEVVVVRMVTPERNGWGDPHGHVAEHSCYFVYSDAWMTCEVSQVMDQHVEHMSECASDYVKYDQENWPWGVLRFEISTFT